MVILKKTWFSWVHKSDDYCETLTLNRSATLSRGCSLWWVKEKHWPSLGCSTHYHRSFLTAVGLFCPAGEYQRAIEVVDTFQIPKYQKGTTSLIKWCDLRDAI